MKLCRFTVSAGAARVGLVADETRLFDLTAAGVIESTPQPEADDPAAEAARLARSRRSACWELGAGAPALPHGTNPRTLLRARTVD